MGRLRIKTPRELVFQGRFALGGKSVTQLTLSVIGLSNAWRSNMSAPGKLQDNSAASQRSRILRHLQEIGPITTLQARHRLDICHPGMRVCELRKSGFPIETIWVNDLTPEGNCHRVARYVLLKRAQLTLFDWLHKA